MKSMTIKTLVMVVMALWVIPSMAAELSRLPMSPAEKDTHRATAATTSIPLYALNRLDAEALARQKMTDQELKAVEGEGIATSPGQLPPYFSGQITKKY